MTRALLAAAVAALVLLALTPAADAQTSTGCETAGAAARFFVPLTIDGAQRSALVNLPARSAGVRLPVVLAFHGASATGPFMEMYTGLTRLSDRGNFVAVYPTANGNLWNSAGRGADREDDIRFVSALLDDLEARLCVDPARVYATGVSNGASFTARLGCELSYRLAAFAPVAGGYDVQPPCHPSRPVSMLEIHGTHDWVVPYDGSGPRHRGSVAGYLARWERYDGCRGATVHRRLGRHVDYTTRRGCAPGTAVAAVALDGGPHIWPGTSYLGGSDSLGVPFSASDAVWEFFSGHRVSKAAVRG